MKSIELGDVLDKQFNYFIMIFNYLMFDLLEIIH